ncbi:MAG: glycosyltransferase family 4 protein [Pseudomonadota bacterium]
MTAEIGVLLKGYPRLSETFIAQELRSLEKRGFRLRFYSLRHPTDTSVHPVHREMEAPVHYLPEYLHQEPVRVLRALAAQVWRPAFWRLLPGFAHHLARDRSRNRVRRLGQAVVLAHELAPDVHRLYAHFLHTPSSVAWYTAQLTGLPWSASAHAKDIYTSPDWELREKLSALDWVATCTAFNHRHLQSLAAAPERVHLVYHGLDFSRFEPAAPRRADGPLQLVSVGRAVPKKGYPVLLDALAALPERLDWRFSHIGGGPELDVLKARAAALGLTARIDWRGALPQDAVIAALRSSDVFVLASQVLADGDRDGLPNVLMEAQSQGVSCVATAVSGIPELIEDGATGRLVPPGDPARLAEAILALADDPDARCAMALAGQRRVRDEFNHDHTMGQLVALFDRASV